MIPVVGRGVVHTDVSDVMAVIGRKVVKVTDIKQLRKAARNGPVTVLVRPAPIEAPPITSLRQFQSNMGVSREGWQTYSLYVRDLNGPQARTRTRREMERRHRIGTLTFGQDRSPLRLAADRLEALPGMRREIRTLPGGEASDLLRDEFGVAGYTTNAGAVVLVAGGITPPTAVERRLGIAGKLELADGFDADITIGSLGPDGTATHVISSPSEVAASRPVPTDSRTIRQHQQGAVNLLTAVAVRLTLPGRGALGQSIRAGKSLRRSRAETVSLAEGTHPAALVAARTDKQHAQTGQPVQLRITRNMALEFPSPAERSTPDNRHRFEHQLAMIVERHLTDAAYSHHLDRERGVDPETAMAQLRRKEADIWRIEKETRKRYYDGAADEPEDMRLLRSTQMNPYA